MNEKASNEDYDPPFTSRSLPADSATDGSISQSSSSRRPPLNDPIASAPLTANESLPTIFKKGDWIYPANDDIDGFLSSDLDLSRLNRIHDQLWMAGRPMRARPLHRYKMLGFELLGTQQMDLHLLKYQNKLMVKPLPEWIFDFNFWKNHICKTQKLYESACGFLLSYVWLITSPLDLKIAHEENFLPASINWIWWKQFVTELYSNIDCNGLGQVNRRYHFGELRLGRINTIYRTRFMFTHFVRGYLYGYNRYGAFFQRYSWVLTIFLFVSIVLSAMQVGVGVSPLQENDAFMNASYGFVVASIVSVAVCLVLALIIYCYIYFFNMILAIRHSKQHIKDREKWREGRKKGPKNA